MNKIPFRISPMLATLVDAPFRRKDWVFEEKYDGVRILAYKEGEKISLISRNAIDRTNRYPAIAKALLKVAANTFLLDGEVVVLDGRKVSRFQLLQQGQGEPRYAAFDCLYKDGRDMRQEPLAARRSTLERLVVRGSVVSLAARVAEDGIEAFDVAVKRGLEGVIAKDSASPYIEGRSKAWLKVKVKRSEEFVVGGFTAPKGTRQHLGALLLGIYRRGQLQYAGKVGTGFNEESLSFLHRKLKRLVCGRSPFSCDVREKSATFVAPKLVVQVGFTECTKDGKLRHPVYLGLRDDKSARDVDR